MTKWEYYRTEDDTSLNALGEDGWELVSVIPSEKAVTFYFKRPCLSLRDRITLDQRNGMIGGGAE